MKTVAVALAIGVVFWAGFIYAAINTLCDDTYWPDWA
jgi:hypothetical protein